ncbi:oligosaccharide flippase family protein [Lysinibacillus piscis]|uniref:Polysaccharide biosynthesis protein n=1 Tax=Lysinibacillus piscis TaxID=2518931 RepID=A0ABQ5NG45_9BACI|nr:oligosaccharide flippase family protein [Lysinibacillus sp. KH24]GLC87316.1 hypothetical protein LYSBPC_04430 [Lysinibacillus sp. KH24]
MRAIQIAAVLSYITIGCTILTSIFFTPMMVSFLGQQEFGLYSLMLGLMGYLSILDLGLGNAIVRYIARNRAIGNETMEAALNGFFLKLFLGIGVLTLFIGWLLFSHIELIFGQSLTDGQLERAKVMGYVMTISLAVQFPLSVFASILQAYEKFIFMKATALLQVVLQPLTMLFFLWQGAGTVTLIAVAATYNSLFLLVDALFCYKVLAVKFTWKFKDTALQKEIFMYALLIFMTVIVDKIYWQTDQLLLGIFKGTVDVAIYAVAIQIVLLFMSLALAVSGLFLPRISILVAQNEWSSINTLFIHVGMVQFLIIGYILGGFYLVGQTFLALWLGEAFVEVYLIVLLIMLPFMIDLIQNIGLNVLKAKNLLTFRTWLLIVIAISNIILSIPAIYYFGKIGTAVVTGCSLLIGNGVVMNIYYAKKVQLMIGRFWQQMGRLALAFLLAIGLTQCIRLTLYRETTWYDMGIILCCYTVFVSGSVFWIGLTKGQRQWVYKGVQRIGIRHFS